MSLFELVWYAILFAITFVHGSLLLISERYVTWIDELAPSPLKRMKRIIEEHSPLFIDRRVIGTGLILIGIILLFSLVT